MRGISSTGRRSRSSSRVQQLAKIAATVLLTRHMDTGQVSISVSPVIAGRRRGLGRVQVWGSPPCETISAWYDSGLIASLISAGGMRPCSDLQPNRLGFLQGAPCHIHLNAGLLRRPEAYQIVYRASEFLLLGQVEGEAWDFFDLELLAGLAERDQAEFVGVFLEVLADTLGGEALHSKPTIDQEFKDYFADYLEVIESDRLWDWPQPLLHRRIAAHPDYCLGLCVPSDRESHPQNAIDYVLMQLRRFSAKHRWSSSTPRPAVN